MPKFQTKTFLGKRPLVLPPDALGGWAIVDIEHGATALLVNDLIEVCEIPPGYEVADFTIIPADIDSGGSPAIVFSLGVENAGGTDLGTEVWGTGFTGFQTGTINRAVTSAASLGDKTVNRKVALKCTTAAATYAGSGKVSQIALLLVG